MHFQIGRFRVPKFLQGFKLYMQESHTEENKKCVLVAALTVFSMFIDFLCAHTCMLNLVAWN